MQLFLFHKQSCWGRNSQNMQIRNLYPNLSDDVDHWIVQKISENVCVIWLSQDIGEISDLHIILQYVIVLKITGIIIPISRPLPVQLEMVGSFLTTLKDLCSILRYWFNIKVSYGSAWDKIRNTCKTRHLKKSRAGCLEPPPAQVDWP